jgi:hypothetical protein
LTAATDAGNGELDMEILMRSTFPHTPKKIGGAGVFASGEIDCILARTDGAIIPKRELRQYGKEIRCRPAAKLSFELK